MPGLMWQKYAGSFMCRSIRWRQVAPQTVQELSDALVQIWEEIAQDTIRCLIRSMPRCYQACIQACGGHTIYWVPFRVAAMKFQQNGLACCIIFSLWFSRCLWIQPLCRLIIFISIKQCGILFFPNTLPRTYRYRYLARYFSPLRSDMFSKCSFSFFEQCIFITLNTALMSIRYLFWPQTF